MKTRRIFVSMPADRWLTDAENDLKWAIVEEIEKRGYVSEVFFDPRGPEVQNPPSLSGGLAWSASGCRDVMRRCDGCVILGFPRWRNGSEQPHLPTEYNHYEGAVAHTLDLPLLVLVRDDVLRRVVFDANYRGYVGVIPADATATWLKTKSFKVPFGYWKNDLKNRRDVFLGYCGSSSKLARMVKRHLKDELGMSVLDWAADFDPSVTILQRIDEAARRCGAGIFLFTKDDIITSEGKPDRAIPRDNVVFEAGYFASVKGKSRALIVLEKGTKMPADLGGDIYANLPTQTSIAPIKAALRQFARAL